MWRAPSLALVPPPPQPRQAMMDILTAADHSARLLRATSDLVRLIHDPLTAEGDRDSLRLALTLVNKVR